jgi:hypothetical protein
MLCWVKDRKSKHRRSVPVDLGLDGAWEKTNSSRLFFSDAVHHLTGPKTRRGTLCFVLYTSCTVCHAHISFHHMVFRWEPPIPIGACTTLPQSSRTTSWNVHAKHGTWSPLTQVAASKSLKLIGGQKSRKPSSVKRGSLTGQSHCRLISMQGFPSLIQCLTDLASRYWRVAPEVGSWHACKIT